MHRQRGKGEPQACQARLPYLFHETNCTPSIRSRQSSSDEITVIHIDHLMGACKRPAMTDFHMIQISDPHLSRDRPFFFFNWDLVVGWINDAKPDLVVCTGDMALNAIASPEDLAFAKSQMDRLEVPWVALPGNHDVGNNRPDIRGEHVVTSEQIAQYREHFGSDFWSRDVGEWTFIGLNSLSMGSALPEEAEQADFLSESLSDAGDRPVALFMHKPMYLSDANEDVMHQGSLYPEPRAALMQQISGANIRLISTGHNHEIVAMCRGETDILWCPATSFLILSGTKARGGGERLPGYLDFRFSGNSFEHEVVLPGELLRIDVGTWLAGGIGGYERFTGGPYPSPR
jgi:3',5'-cyclic AMP phosphodiesterase CpdA